MTCKGSMDTLVWGSTAERALLMHGSAHCTCSTGMFIGHTHLRSEVRLAEQHARCKGAGRVREAQLLGEQGCARHRQQAQRHKRLVAACLGHHLWTSLVVS